MGEQDPAVFLTQKDQDAVKRPSSKSTPNKDGTPAGFKPVGRIEYTKRKYKVPAIKPEEQAPTPKNKEVL